MYIGLQGVQIGQTAGAASAVKLPFQIGFAATQLQPSTSSQSEPVRNLALPAAQTINASAVVIFDSFVSVGKQVSDSVASKTEEQKLADAMNATASDLWKLAARFLQNPDALTVQFTQKAAKTTQAHVQSKNAKKITTKSAPVPEAQAASIKAHEATSSDADSAKRAARSKAKTNLGVMLLGNGVELEDASPELPNLSKATAGVSTGKVPSETAPLENERLNSDAVVAAAGPFESVVPYSVSHLERARTILRAAKAVSNNNTAVSFTQNTLSPAISRNAPASKADSNIERAPENSWPVDGGIRRARTFTRSQAVGRSPAFLVGNIRTRKAHKSAPAQIVRVAIAGKASRRIVFARVPGKKGEYRFAGIERQERRLESLKRSAPHALAAPQSEQQIQPTVLTLAPRGAGESAYTMPDPRELRSDERQVLMTLIKKQLSMGPASLNDPKVREQFNGFMFSNTVGEMSHYVTSDQWSAMMRAAILYAARAVLPFSNNSIAGMAAEYLFDEMDVDSADAERRYDEWLAHFGISSLGDIALMDTFVDEDRVLTMPEYFLKGIMDYLTELAPLMHAYDEETMPFPFTTELNLQWETIAFVHDPAISNDEELVYAATAFAEEIAALDVRAAQHFVELVLLSTRVNTDSIQGVWSDEQAVAFLTSSIRAGLSDVLDPIGRNSTLPRYVRRLLAKAKEARNAQEDRHELGLELLTKNLADAIQNGVFSIEMDEEELRLN